MELRAPRVAGAAALAGALALLGCAAPAARAPQHDGKPLRGATARVSHRSSSVAGQGPAAPELARLRRLAQQELRGMHGAHMQWARAVRSTEAVAAAVTMGSTGGTAAPVWVLQVASSSTFTCETCSEPARGRAPRGRYLVVIVDAGTRAGYDFGVSARATNLGRLGRVVDVLP